MKKILFLIFTFVCFTFNINALCYDDDLNDWALNVDVKFIDFNRNLINEKTGKPLYETMDYSYILSLNNMRDDIVLKATTDYGAELEGIYVPGHKVYGIVDYTPKNGAIYSIRVYGSEDSKCSNELLKISISVLKSVSIKTTSCCSIRVANILYTFSYLLYI